MSRKESKLTDRDAYTVRNLIADLKKIGCTPSVLDMVGREVVYFEWTQASDHLGPDHPVTIQLESLLEFMRGGCEQMLIEGELCRVADTPTSAINSAIKGAPKEFLSYRLIRSSDHIRNVLEQAMEERKREKKRYKAIEKGIRTQIGSNPDDPDLWNQLRLLLWLIGKYKDSNEAFKKAKKLGWKSENSGFVAV
ncbi:MAG: hypothetical protein EAX81_02130 [Candidatus Thorarchaeota archaeon]|nr:hypothetical protein [Candidatus Thorarchaeota archaeon]